LSTSAYKQRRCADLLCHRNDRPAVGKCTNQVITIINNCSGDGHGGSAARCNDSARSCCTLPALQCPTCWNGFGDAYWQSGVSHSKRCAALWIGCCCGYSQSRRQAIRTTSEVKASCAANTFFANGNRGFLGIRKRTIYLIPIHSSDVNRAIG
jgi:hypothetical protein